MVVITVISDCESIKEDIVKYIVDRWRDNVTISLLDPVKDACASCFLLKRNKDFSVENKDIYDERWDSTPRDLVDTLEESMRSNFGPNHLVKIAIQRTREFIEQGKDVIVTDAVRENEVRGLRVIFASIVLKIQTKDEDEFKEIAHDYLLKLEDLWSMYRECDTIINEIFQ